MEAKLRKAQRLAEKKTALAIELLIIMLDAFVVSLLDFPDISEPLGVLGPAPTTTHKVTLLQCTLTDSG